MAAHGNKVWTSGAHEADAFFVLARRLRSIPPTARRPEPVHRGPARARRRDPADHLHGRRPPLQRGAPPGSSSRMTASGAVASGNKSPPSSALSAAAPSGSSPPSSCWPPPSGMADGWLPLDAGPGRHVARHALHQMSFAVSTAQAYPDADRAAAVVKVLGTTGEGDVADYVDFDCDRPGGGRELTRSCTPRSSSDPASPCAAGPTRSARGHRPRNGAALMSTTNDQPDRHDRIQRPRESLAVHAPADPDVVRPSSSSTTTGPSVGRPEAGSSSTGSSGNGSTTSA